MFLTNISSLPVPSAQLTVYFAVNSVHRPIMVPIQRLPASLTPLDAALAGLLERLERVRPVELPLADALGCVAADMAAPKPQPPRDLATQDGWAMHSRDLVGASSYSPFQLPTMPIWIEAGAPMPEGCDCVVDRDSVDRAGPSYQVLAEAIPGQGVRRAGEDFSGETSAIAAGRIVTASDLLFARKTGLQRLSVRRPRLRIVNIPIGQSRDTAVTLQLIAENARAEGAEVMSIEAGGRDVASIVEALNDHGCDVLVTIGGTGRGHADEAIPAIAKCGEIIAHGLALQPGRTSAVGRVGGVPLIALPGAPDQALAAWWTLGLAVLDRLADRGSRARQILALSHKIASQVGLAEVALLARADERWVPLAVGDLSLSAIARADAWIVVPDGSEGFAAGTLVDAYILRD
jgi:molybdopterin molybdotransferase